MKLWQKEGLDTHAAVDRFTTGSDPVTDLRLAPFDILGSMAHAIMLHEVGLLETPDLHALLPALRDLYAQATSGQFTIEPGMEDVHSQVEALLTQRCGAAGQRIHTARSRNDQVLLDLLLYYRQVIKEMVREAEALAQALLAQGEKYETWVIPGYTHTQPAMPSSFGLWFSAYAESLVADLEQLAPVYQLCNRSPLGSAAGYGVSLPIDRQRVADLLGMPELHYNVVFAQMLRGKAERFLAQAMANVAATLNKLAADVCLYVNPQFGFMKLPAAFTTGSSIMPHKKNPDVFELVRGHCNFIQGLPTQIMLATSNMTSGYHRDYQLLKAPVFTAIDNLMDCLQLTRQMVEGIEPIQQDLSLLQHQYLFSVDEVNRLVRQGMPFRQAYQQVGAAIEAGHFVANVTNPLEGHTHQGGLGDPGFKAISLHLQEAMDGFNFEYADNAIAALLNYQLPIPFATGR